MRPAPATAVPWCLVAALWAALARAEDASRTADIARLQRHQLESGPAVTLRGQVIALEPGKEGTEAILEDADGGIRILGIEGRVGIGDDVEITGRAGPGHPAAAVRATGVVVTGHRPLPPPRRCDIDAFFAGGEECRLVEVEGIVERAWTAGGEVHLEIQAAGRLFGATLAPEAAARLLPPGGEPRGLVDTRVVIGGAAGSERTRRGEILRPVIRVARGEWCAIVEPAVEPAVAPEVISPETIGRGLPQARAGHRVRTYGEVIHAVPGATLFLQNGHYGIRVGLAPEAAGADVRFARGDRVEVVGFVDRSGPVASLRNAWAARRPDAAIGTPPRPIVATPAVILDANRPLPGATAPAEPGDYQGCLIAFSGVVLQTQPTEEGGIVLLRCDATIVTAEADGPTFSAVGGTVPGSFVQVTGVVAIDREWHAAGDRPASPQRLRLFLRDADDFRVIQAPSWWTATRLLAVLGLTAAILTAAIAWAVTLRRELAAQRRLLAAEMRSRRDAALEFEATLRERNRLAANLHDTLQQTIGGIGFQLDACEAAGGGQPPDAGRHFAVARRMVDHAAKELQGSVWAMRSLPLDGRPFAEALAALVSRVGEGHDVALAVACDGPLDDLPEFVAGSLLLVIQEAVHNALRHGHARRIDVAVAEDRASGALRASVSDDGRGFAVGVQPGPREGHFGIDGMRERAERLGGSLAVHSRPGGGTTVTVTVQRRDYDADIGAPLAHDRR